MGVISGLLFGVYLVGIKAMDNVTYVDGYSLSIITDKSTYEPDDVVEIRIINTGTHTLDFSNVVYGFYVTDLLNITILTPSYDCATDDTSQDIITESNIIECIADSLSYAGITVVEPEFDKLSIMATLAPGDEAVLLWDQTQNDMTPVMAGVYKIHTESSSFVVASTTIVIL